MRHRIFYCTLTWVTYFLLNGCINLGPDYHQPDVKVDIPETYQNAPSETKALEVGDRWWTVFGDSDISLSPIRPKDRFKV